ncbi:type II toxin-antitoxin system VapC family toxin [Agrobacterium sp. rho-13.3]|uniref:type II toxin-antitoxin system VapC family toxin n=1 Tax=Agrobacterium sp. rho-13.3 TaxID=3072980 RepID=UPI002A12EDCB|nr:type II toxin-antitoxin system VapC family toxin [Agrobacterium sp. rho-13.3]MDX8311269.1 type II toxin-antitoxin system VapC family toxin [Agrobacterium sp. rho-13.3]
MIVIDTSALMAILLEEPKADACASALEEADRLVISAGTFAEALIVASRRNIAEELDTLIKRLGVEIVDVTPAYARLIADAYNEWGKGVHPASLNFGDCFAYALAKSENCPLLYVGNDFSRTDIISAL